MDSVEIRGLRLTFFGHATFFVEWNGKTACFDPFVLPASPPKADFVFITHEHTDHCNPDAFAKVCSKDTVLVCAVGVSEKLGTTGRELREGETLELGGLKIKAIAAYNLEKPFHPRGLGVGFLVDFDGTRIYHAGDTDCVPEMRALTQEKVDIALLPAGGFYTMDVTQAAVAASIIKPVKATPMHYGFVPKTTADTKLFEKLAAEWALVLESKVKRV